MRNNSKIAAIVLAAGKGTRLAGGYPSPKPKVLYKLATKPIITYTLKTLKKIKVNEVVIVVGYQANEVIKIVGPGYKFAYQRNQLGTAHGVQVGLVQISKDVKNVLVLNGDDSAFYKPETIKKVLDRHVTAGNTLTFVTLSIEDPTGLGRIIRENGNVIAVIEDKVATEKQKKIKEVNDGLYVFSRKWLEKNLKKVKKSSSGEYYLVDLIFLAIKDGSKVTTFKLKNPHEWFGINTKKELREADSRMKKAKK